MSTEPTRTSTPAHATETMRRAFLVVTIDEVVLQPEQLAKGPQRSDFLPPLQVQAQNRVG